MEGGKHCDHHLEQGIIGGPPSASCMCARRVTGDKRPVVGSEEDQEDLSRKVYSDNLFSEDHAKNPSSKKHATNVIRGIRVEEQRRSILMRTPTVERLYIPQVGQTYIPAGFDPAANRVRGHLLRPGSTPNLFSEDYSRNLLSEDYRNLLSEDYENLFSEDYPGPSPAKTWVGSKAALLSPRTMHDFLTTDVCKSLWHSCWKCTIIDKRSAEGCVI